MDSIIYPRERGPRILRSPKEYNKLGLLGKRLQVHFRVWCKCWVRQWKHACVCYGSCLDEFPTVFYVCVLWILGLDSFGR